MINPLTQHLIDAIGKHCYVGEWWGPYDEHNPLYADCGILIEMKPVGFIAHRSFTNLTFAVQFHLFGDAHFIETLSNTLKFILVNNQYELPLHYQNSRFFASASMDYSTADNVVLWAKIPFTWYLDEVKNIYYTVQATIKVKVT
jgi:hypothetical protein